jgi:hypothetical protein
MIFERRNMLGMKKLDLAALKAAADQIEPGKS